MNEKKSFMVAQRNYWAIITKIFLPVLKEDERLRFSPMCFLRSSHQKHFNREEV